MKALKPILYAAALCGVLDITAAWINSYMASGVTFTRLLQGVAGGFLGRGAYQGGFAAPALGLALHFTMALIVASGFYALSRRFPLLLKHAVAAGLLYGAAVFAINNFGTALLLSWVRSLYMHTAVVFKPPMGWSQLIIHLFCVGLPVALVIAHYSRKPSP